MTPTEALPGTRILFVDDEQNVLDALRRSMHGMRSTWQMTFVSSGAEALNMMAISPADVVVSDMRMPGMSGRDLLMEVKRLYPNAVRFILSGYADSSSIMQVAGTAHQYLSKPCDSATLKGALTRTVKLRRLLTDKQLLSRIGRVDSLPALPHIYEQMVSCLQGESPSIAEVARIVASDVVMTTMIMKLANSAFFGSKQTFKAVDRAVAFLGLETISGLVLGHSIFKNFNGAKSNLDLAALWEHSLRTAAAARALARHERWTPEKTEEAFLAGVVHDLGKLVLAACPPEGIEAAPDETHAEVGAYLLGLWGFSDTLIEAIAFHHAPSKSVGEWGLPAILHVADCLAHGDESIAGDRRFETAYFESLGLSCRLKEWQAAWVAVAA